MSNKLLQSLARCLIPRLQALQTPRPVAIWQCERFSQKKQFGGVQSYCSDRGGLFDDDDDFFEPGPPRNKNLSDFGSRRDVRRDGDYSRGGFSRNRFGDDGHDGFNRGGFSRDRFGDDGFRRGGNSRDRFGDDGFNRGGFSRPRLPHDDLRRGGFSRDRFGDDDFRRGGNSRNRFEDNGFNRGGFSRDRFGDDGFGRGRDLFGDDAFNTPRYSGEELVFERNIYSEHPNVKARDMGEVAQYLKSYDIVCTGEDVPKPVMTFEEANFPDTINYVLARQGFEHPTPIQSVTWPIALSGRDCIGIAQTGSGKTLGYILPALAHTMKMKESGFFKGPFVVVLAPTRELVQQIKEVTLPYTNAMNLRSVAVFGGASRNMQLQEMNYGCDILIATPGRLNDFTSTGCFELSKVAYFVLDEADRMLDMGFEPQIRKVERQITKNRQTLMWSATWPREIKTLGRQFLNNPVEYHVGSRELTPNPDIVQVVKVVSFSDKMKHLMDDLRSIFSPGNPETPDPKVLIFTNTKRQADFLSYRVSETDRQLRIRAMCLHGDKTQRERDYATESFSSGRISVLVATEVAARGLDVKGITHVINYDFPRELETYIHRIGRTGRAGNKGTAISYFTEESQKLSSDLVRLLEDSGQNVPDDLGFSGGSQRRRGFMRKSDLFSEFE